VRGADAVAKAKPMKKRFFTAACLLFALANVASAQQGGLPPALLAAIAATQSAKVAYAFDYSFASAQANVSAHFDPKTTPQLRLTGVDEAQLRNDQRQMLNQLRQQVDGVSWCAGDRMAHIANAQLIHEDAATATYSFQPTRDSTRGQAAQYADRLRGEITITKSNPDVTAIHIFTPTAFDPIPFVHIANVDARVTCELAPNGRRYAAQTVSQTSGSGFGQSLDQRNVQHVTNLSAAP
jgi:hypothetical protein